MKKLLFLLFCFPIFFVNKINAYQVLDDETFEMATGQSGENQGDEVDQKDVEAGIGSSRKQRITGDKNWRKKDSNILKFVMRDYNDVLKKEWYMQSISVSENVQSDFDSENFTITASLKGEWIENGGEFGHPPYYWVDSTGEGLEEIVKNDNNYVESRFFKYLMVCKIKDYNVTSLPSYINLENKEITKNNEIRYQFSLNEQKSEEVEIELKQVVDCDFFAKSKGTEYDKYEKNENIEEIDVYKHEPYASADPDNRTFVSKMIIDTSELKVPNEEKIVKENFLQTNNLLLESLFVDNNQLKPEFNSNYFYYQVELDKIASSSPKIIASAYDSDNQVTIDSPLDINSDKKEERTAYINVIAPNNKSRKTYTIDFSYKKQKNYLLSLSSALATLNPEFSKYKNHYQIDLSKKKELFVDNQSIETILKSIKANSENSSDKITIMPVEFKPNNSVTVLISLVSSDKLKSNQYYLTFFADERMWYF